MTISRFQRSSLGAFVRSNLGVRGQSNTWEADGVATTEFSDHYTKTLIPYSMCDSVRNELTYGGILVAIQTTIHSSSGSNLSIQQAVSGIPSTWYRTRIGATYSLEDSYPVGTTFVFDLNANGSFTGDTSYLPNLYISSTDNSGLYSNTSTKSAYDWETDFGVNVGTHARTSPVTWTLNYSDLAPFFGSRVSFVCGLDKDLNGTGTGVQSSVGYTTFPKLKITV